MKGNILSTLGVFTTFCQPVSSCVYGTSLLPLAEGGLEGSQFGLTYPVGLLEWSQTISTADGSKVDNLGVLVHETMETLAKSNAVTEFNIGASSEHRVAREYFSVPSNYDFDTTGTGSLFNIFFLTSVASHFLTYQLQLSPLPLPSTGRTAHRS
jgi:hypothetical protein